MNTLNPTRLLLAGAFLLTVAIGCSKTPPPVQQPGVESDRFVGTWQESREPMEGGAFIPSDDPLHRRIEITADGTFRLWFTDKDGKTTNDDQFVSGKWSKSEGYVELSVSENKLTGDTIAAETPTIVARIALKESTGAPADQIQVKTANGGRWYHRVE